MTKRISILVSPTSQGAFFHQWETIALKECALIFPETKPQLNSMGSMRFIELEAPESALSSLTRLSCAQGFFERTGDGLRPLSLVPDFPLHQDFITGTKYRGKTNEVLTQALVNIGRHFLPTDFQGKLKLLDPMCGRGTTLLWALQYGFMAKGIEQDPKALDDFERHVKKWCKIHRVKHRFERGRLTRDKKGTQGRFVEWQAADGAIRMVCGDTTQASNLLNRERFDLLVTDIPYGVEHTQGRKRSPLDTLRGAAPEWAQLMAKQGVLVLSFNSNLPKRNQLKACFVDAGLVELDFELPHRMSESILRDVMVLQRPA